MTTPAPPTVTLARQAVAADAVRRFAIRRRRWWLWYGGVLAVVFAFVVGAVAFLWQTGEAANAHLRTAVRAAPNLPRVPTSARLSLAWRSPDATAIGDPFTNGTVVTYSTHTVTGRNATSGRAMWIYTRTDATVCQVAQEQGKTLAVYERDGNCDEISAFDTGTGKRAWQRTLDENMTPISGRPDILALPDTLFVWTGAAIYAVGIDGGRCRPEYGSACGADHFSYDAPDGCTITHVVPGSIGVLISEQCKTGDMLLLRDRYQSADNGNDRLLWSIKSSAVPVTADYFVAAIEPGSSQLTSFNHQTGKVLFETPLKPAPDVSGGVSELILSDGVLIRAGALTYGLTLTGSAMLWSASEPALPSLEPENGRIVYLPAAGGVSVLSARDGTEQASIPGPSTAGASEMVPMGSGFLAGGATTVALR